MNVDTIIQKHQTEFVFDYIQDYDIKHKFGCYTSDNVSLNNICVIFFQEWFLRVGVNWDATKNCMQCLRHVINFLFQVFLFVKSKETLQAAINATIEVVDGNINNATFKSFAGASTKFNTRLQALQLSQTKAKRNVCNKWKIIASVKDFGNIKMSFMLQKFHRLAV